MYEYGSTASPMYWSNCAAPMPSTSTRPSASIMRSLASVNSSRPASLTIPINSPGKLAKLSTSS